ncbi:MAG: glucosyl transferase [Ignavibacteriae bacterium]|nr:glucosyl transferase [Ignavibacteriota bacterium]
MLRKTVILIFILIGSLLIIYNCDTTEPNKAILELQLEDASCTEVWLTLKTNNLQIPANINLFVNEKNKRTIRLNEVDTVLYVDSLLPNQTYNIYTTVEKQLGLSNKIQVTTLDTTSHNITWQTFLFGEHSSSVLYDVAVIDENNIWAVGEIYMNDSLGNSDPHAYNVAHWDGRSWELKRTMFYTICGQLSLSSYPANTIFAFSDNDIWIAGGGRQLVRIKGISQIDKICLPFSMVINKLWGASNKDIYAVGNGSPIAHYNGYWEKTETSTALPFQDIWGSKKIKENDFKILCVASDKYEGHGPEVYEIKNNLIIPQMLEGLPWSISSVWFKNELKTYIVGDGIYIQNPYSANKTWKNVNNNISSYYMHTIRGNDVNDIFIGGAGGEIVHFNGVTWKTYKNDGVPNFYGNYLSVSVKENIVCFVGNYIDDKVKAIITIGRR